MTRGFAPPAEGTPMCQYKVVWDQGTKLLDKPRPCRRAAKPGTTLCGPHAYRMKKRTQIEGRDGGFCFVCASPARTYVFPGVSLAICPVHGDVLARAIQEHR